MKLYRLSVIVGNTTIERGVWAEDMIIVDECYYFRNYIKQHNEYELVQSYPAQLTFITSIETKEEYDARKAK